jgi:hypothetical protein
MTPVPHGKRRVASDAISSKDPHDVDVNIPVNNTIKPGAGPHTHHGFMLAFDMKPLYPHPDGIRRS